MAQNALEKSQSLFDQFQAQLDDAAARNEQLIIEIASNAEEIKLLNERLSAKEKHVENEKIKLEISDKIEEISTKNEEIKAKNDEIFAKSEEIERLKKGAGEVKKMRKRMKTIDNDRFKLAKECKRMMAENDALEKENERLKNEAEIAKNEKNTEKKKTAEMATAESAEIEMIREKFGKERYEWEEKMGVLENALIEKEEEFRKAKGVLKEVFCF